MQTDAAKLRLDHTLIPAVCWRMRQHCVGTLVQQRTGGNFDDAHRTTDRLLALAERLLQSYPNQAASYMLLSEAYVARAKLADPIEEGPMIESWERNALDAAIHAATLDSRKDEALVLVKDRRARVRMAQMIHRFIFQVHDHLTANEWADRVVQSMSSTSGADRMRHLESEAGYWFIFQSLCASAAAERRTAKLDDARRTVDRIHALAKLLLARYPEQAAAHLCLSEAFSQRAKNAWRSDDRVAIERNLRLALDESRQALRLDPRMSGREPCDRVPATAR